LLAGRILVITGLGKADESAAPAGVRSQRGRHACRAGPAGVAPSKCDGGRRCRRSGEAALSPPLGGYRTVAADKPAA
jgi:hypothetical protein